MCKDGYVCAITSKHCNWNHIHKKRKNSLDTRAVYIEVSLLSWNLPHVPKIWGSILRNTGSSVADQPLAGALHAVIDKIEGDILQTAIKLNWIWIFIYQGSFEKDSSYKMPVLHQSTCTLVSEVWAKYKDVPTKILKCEARRNLG